MAVQFSLSYDEKGDPVLVENTVTGTRKVVSTSPVVSEFKSRFDTADPVTDAEENQPDSNQSPIYDYINEMESGAANDINLSFIEKQNLERYTPEAIAKKEAPLTKLQSLFQSAVKAVIPAKAEAGLALLKIISKFIPEESPEIKAIKQHYATPEMANLVESIPGMSNYNLVYGNPFDPSYGLANAAAKRQAVIDKTLANKYGLTPAEIAQTKLGTYKGPVSSDLIDRNKKLQDLQDKEKEEITTNPAYGYVPNPVVNLTPEQKSYFVGTNPQQNNNNNDSGNQGGGGFDTSAADKAGTSEGSGQFSPSTSRGRSGY